MNKNSNSPSPLSIILEWDNIRLSEMDRSRAMVEGLALQVGQLRKNAASLVSTENGNFLTRFQQPVDLLITYNNQHIDEKVVKQVISEIIPLQGGGLEVGFLGAPGLNYYQLKNLGAQHVESELIVFVDCDTIPDKDWLINLISPFAESHVEVVGGIQYIEPRSIYTKTFALTWLFPLRSEDKEVIPFPRFWAGNVAFRKETFSRFPFPEYQDMGRGACRLLATTLLKNGVSIYRSTGAQFNHPAPNGLRHFIMRGISHGRDRLLIVKRTTGAKPVTLWQSCAFFARNVGRTMKRVIRDRSRVGLSIFDLPIAMTIGGFYYFLFFAGELMTHFKPAYMTNRFKL